MEKVVTLPLRTAHDLLALAVVSAEGRKQTRTVNALRDAIRAAQVAPAAPAPLFDNQKDGAQ